MFKTLFLMSQNSDSVVSILLHICLFTLRTKLLTKKTHNLNFENYAFFRALLKVIAPKQPLTSEELFQRSKEGGRTDRSFCRKTKKQQVVEHQKITVSYNPVITQMSQVNEFFAFLQYGKLFLWIIPTLKLFL